MPGMTEFYNPRIILRLPGVGFRLYDWKKMGGGINLIKEVWYIQSTEENIEPLICMLLQFEFDVGAFGKYLSG